MMHAFCDRSKKVACECFELGCERVKSICAHPRVRSVVYGVFRLSVAVLAMLGAYVSYRLLSGSWEAITLGESLSGRIPELLIPTTLFFDTFSALFMAPLVVLAISDILKERTFRSWISKGVLLGITGLLFGATTPLSVITLLGAYAIWILVERGHRSLAFGGLGILGMVSAMLMMSFGAFLGDIRLLGQVLPQLPLSVIHVAFTLLFAGALFGAQREVPSLMRLGMFYLLLRIAFFFVGAVSLSWLAILALGASLVACALVVYRRETESSSFWYTFALGMVPLALLAIAREERYAIEGFLFSGILAMFVSTASDLHGVWSDRLGIRVRAFLYGNGRGVGIGNLQGFTVLFCLFGLSFFTSYASSLELLGGVIMLLAWSIGCIGEYTSKFPQIKGTPMSSLRSGLALGVFLGAPLALPAFFRLMGASFGEGEDRFSLVMNFPWGVVTLRPLILVLMHIALVFGYAMLRMHTEKLPQQLRYGVRVCMASFEGFSRMSERVICALRRLLCAFVGKTGEFTAQLFAQGMSFHEGLILSLLLTLIAILLF